MTLTQLATLFNVLAVVYVVAVSLLVFSGKERLYMRFWVFAHLYMVAYLVVPMFVPVDTTPWGLWGSPIILLSAWYFIRIGTYFQKKPVITERTYGIICGLVAISSLLIYLHGGPSRTVLMPSLLLQALTMVRLGLIFLFDVKTKRSWSLGWLTVPFLIMGLSPAIYPFIPPSLDWIGYALASALHVMVGTGMVVFLLEENQAKTQALLQEKLLLQENQLQTLHQAEKMKEEFISVISHELRTPLNLISGFGSLLGDEVAGPLNPQQHEFLKKLQLGSERMLDLVNNLIDFACLRAQKMEIVLEETAYETLVRETFTLFSPLAEAQGITMTLDIQITQSIDLDPKRIRQVLGHLIANAIKFTPSGGSIQVSVFFEGDSVKTLVEDTGIGIQEESLLSIFMPFRQLDMSSTRSAGGTGLGLSICKALIEAHCGSIGAMSDGLNAGATVWFTLPRIQEPIVPNQALEPTA